MSVAAATAVMRLNSGMAPGARAATLQQPSPRGGSGWGALLGWPVRGETVGIGPTSTAAPEWAPWFFSWLVSEGGRHLEKGARGRRRGLEARAAFGRRRHVFSSAQGRPGARVLAGHRVLMGSFEAGVLAGTMALLVGGFHFGAVQTRA